MDIDTREKLIYSAVEQDFLKEQKKITSNREWINFSNAHKNLFKISLKGGLPFNPKINAVLWAFDVARLCNEIIFGYCWMNSYAELYKKRVTPGSQPAHVDFHVSYFADNCITRIDSCRDKLALMVWAFYCAFNPEKRDEILDYQRIMDRVGRPIKFGLKLNNPNGFLKNLKNLRGVDFDRIEKYRNFKIHRRETRIEIYGVEPHHDWDYMFPLTDKNDIARWEEELEGQYPDPRFREHIKKGCYIDGVLFERRKINGRLWDFEEVQKHIKSCLMKLLKASDGCFRILGRRLLTRRLKSLFPKK
jgi:hypothetical protein